MSSIKSKKGHFILEAAIFLPIFVLAFLAIGQLINIAGVRNAVMHSASDEVSKVARFSYKVKQADIYRKKVSDRVISSAKGANDVNIRDYEYLKEDDLISFEVHYNCKNKIKIGVHQNVYMADRILCRAFTGKKLEGAMGFDAMQGIGDDEVWIFPENGRCYHRVSCTYVRSSARSAVKTGSILSKYQACKKCMSGNSAPGSMVYVFENGEKFHLRTCITLNKICESMGKDEAQKNGYAPCSKCRP